VFDETRSLKPVPRTAILAACHDFAASSVANTGCHDRNCVCLVHNAVSLPFHLRQKRGVPIPFHSNVASGVCDARVRVFRAGVRKETFGKAIKMSDAP
jgi:hypothetical protein